MAKNGLKANIQSTLLLSTALKTYEIAEKRSSDRKSYANALQNFCKLIDKATADKDVTTLLSLEEDALCYNFHKSNTDKDKELCREGLFLLKKVKKEWLQSQSKENVVNDTIEVHKNIDMPSKPIKNVTMTTDTGSLTRKINSIAGRDRTPTEIKFYRKRSAAIKFIAHEHCKLINKHLGLNAPEKENPSKSKNLSL